MVHNTQTQLLHTSFGEVAQQARITHTEHSSCAAPALPAPSTLRSSVRRGSVTTKRVTFNSNVDELRRTARDEPDRCMGICYRRERGTTCARCLRRLAQKRQRRRSVSISTAPLRDTAFAMSHARMRAEWLATVTGHSAPAATTIVPVVYSGPHVYVWDHQQAFPRNHSLDASLPRVYKMQGREHIACLDRDEFHAAAPSDTTRYYELRCVSGIDGPYIVHTNDLQRTTPPTAPTANTQPDTPSNSATLIAKPSTGIRLIMDTGCGDSIISYSDVVAAGYQVRTVPRGRGKTFVGVGTTTMCTHKVTIPLTEFREQMEFWAMGSTPPLSSVGKRCSEQGFSFVWLAGGQPYFVAPWGNTIPLVVQDNIPYLHIGSPECAPVPTTQDHLHIPHPPLLRTAVAGSVSSDSASVLECTARSGRSQCSARKCHIVSNDHVCHDMSCTTNDTTTTTTPCDAEADQVAVSAGPAGADSPPCSLQSSPRANVVHAPRGRWRKRRGRTCDSSSGIDHTPSASSLPCAPVNARVTGVGGGQGRA